MSSMNHVILMGNLTRDPEKRTTPTGMVVSDLGVAVSDNYKDKDGKLVERTCFADVVVWGRQAETCVEYLKKGAPVVIEGKLQLDQWKTESGENRSKLRVKANRVQFLGRRATPEASGSAAATPVEEMTETVPF